MKKYIVGILIGILLSSTVAYAASYLYHADEVSFTPNNSNWNVDSVDNALNDLYDKLASSGGANGTLTVVGTLHNGCGHTGNEYYSQNSTVTIVISVTNGVASLKSISGNSNGYNWGGFGNSITTSVRSNASFSVTSVSWTPAE